LNARFGRNRWIAREYSAISTPILVAVAGPESGGDWGLVAAIATAAAALATLLFRELQRRREDLDQKVANAVSAGLGRTFLEFRELEEGAKETLSAVLETATGIEKELRERLEVSEEHSARLAELLDQAAEVVPQLSDSRSALPSLLVYQAIGATPEASLPYLTALLGSELAASDELVTGGNIASSRGATSLALELYAKALEINPLDADAAASLIRLRTRTGQLSPAEGIAEMTEVMSRHPNERNAMSEALNLFVELDDYEGMLEFIDERLKGDDRNPLLWRNRAIALAELRAPQGDVIKAYERSFALGFELGNESEVSNTARPYASFLRRSRRYKDARTIVETALAGDPRSAQLMLLLGDLEEGDGRAESAEWCYLEAKKHADRPGESTSAEQKLQDLEARRTLRQRGLLATMQDGRREPRDEVVDPTAEGEGFEPPRDLDGP
jgi:tetratricopeptide (TPR) repeat protein